MNTSHHEVIIVGAGPTGLALAAEMHRLGSPALLLDRLPAGANTSRAAVVHSRTLEVLEPLGVTPELIERGLPVPTFSVRDRQRILTTISFKELDTCYPYTLMCPQDVIEAVLLRRLESCGGHVQRPCEVVRIVPGASDVQVHFTSGNETHIATAEWVVGCDGMHSVVREQAGIPFQGGSYEETFLLADVEMDWPLSREEVCLFLSPDGLLVVAALPGDRFRLVAGAHNPAAELALADFQNILDERGPAPHAAALRTVLWSSHFHIHHRVAKCFRKGRVLIAGDAAHVHSPAGGQGMNLGIQDAMSLSCILYGVLQDNIDAELDFWQSQRLKLAHSVVDMTDRITKVATVSSPALQRVRNTVFGIVGHIPSAQQKIAEKLSALGNH